MFVVPWISAAFGWEELGAEGVPTGRVFPAAERFAPGALPSGELRGSPADLAFVAEGAASELREQIALGSALGRGGALSELGVGLDDTLATLDLVRDAAAGDLADPAWIARHFDAWRWSPDRDAAAARQVALAADEIRLTSYLVYGAWGAPARDDAHDTALYAVPVDEWWPGASPVTRLRYTRPEVFGGVFEAGGVAAGAARPLVWLAREDVRRALMQGTVEVWDTDGGAQMYNVDRNNGVPYDPAVKDGDQQRRYWYFRPVDGVLGVEQIPLRAHVSVAGDVYNLGLGTVLALAWDGPSGPEVHLVVLADTGGAFQPNLFQLDWLAGTFPDHDAYAAWEGTLPRRVRAAILVRKRDG